MSFHSTVRRCIFGLIVPRNACVIGAKRRKRSFLCTKQASERLFMDGGIVGGRTERGKQTVGDKETSSTEEGTEGREREGEPPQMLREDKWLFVRLSTQNERGRLPLRSNLMFYEMD